MMQTEMLSRVEDEPMPDVPAGVTRFHVLILGTGQPQREYDLEVGRPPHEVSEADVLFEILDHMGPEGRELLEIVSLSQEVRAGQAILPWLKVSRGRYDFNRRPDQSSLT